MERKLLKMWKADLEFLEGSGELTTTERHLKMAVDHAITLERENAAYDKANKDFQGSLVTANKERAALKTRLKVEQASVNELSLHCQELELRLKGAVSIGEDMLNYIDVDNLTMQANERRWKEALKGLGKEVEDEPTRD